MKLDLPLPFFFYISCKRFSPLIVRTLSATCHDLNLAFPRDIVKTFCVAATFKSAFAKIFCSS